MTAKKMISEWAGMSRARLTALGLLALGLLVVAPAMAANVLQDVRYASAPGGKVDITLQFAQPVGEVQAFTTDTPPRIAIDLPGTTNGLTQRRVVVGSGATSAVSAAEAGGRTRVVVDLFRPAGYTTRSSGNMLIVTVDAGAAPMTASTAMANAVDPAKRSASTLSVANIDFRRGDNGSGRVVLKFNSDGAAADMRTEGSQIIVDVGNAALPESLRRRLDVTDFATPVQSLEPRSNAAGTRLVINTNGDNETMAYQTGNEYVVEITPKRSAAMASAKAGGSGMDRGAGAVGTAGQVQRYTGKPVTFNFQDVPVRTVLQLIAEESNLNIVAADTVVGNITLRLVNVPWDQALDIVLRAKGLDKRKDGTVVWIGPQKELADYDTAREDARLALEQRQELVTEYIPINYGDAEKIATAITTDAKKSSGGGGGGQTSDRGFLSPRGSIGFDNRTNMIFITDIPSKVQTVKELIARLDRAVDQVLIEARIVVASETFAREIGSRFGIADRNGIDFANPGTSTDSGFQVNLPASNAAGSFGFTILKSNLLLDLELSALETEGRGEVISNPRVITSNQREALIRQGDEIGYTTTQANSTSTIPQTTVAFKEVLLEMKVTPTITQDGRVYLQMGVKKDEVKSFVSTPSGDIPQIQKREVNTAVLVENGQTVVIGGVYEFKNREDISKFPWLGDLPLLGNLFRKKGKDVEKAELLIFVTPRVLQVAAGR